MTPSAPEGCASRTLVTFVADLAGYTAAFKVRSDGEMAGFLDRYYRVAEDLIGEDGWIVKFMGDAVLAVFPETAASVAVAAAVALRSAVEQIAEACEVSAGLGVNLHMGPVVEGKLGHGPSRRRDIVGHTVNQTFLMGRGPGIRISEPVYLGLPGTERTSWTPSGSPAIYTLGGTDEG